MKTDKTQFKSKITQLVNDLAIPFLGLFVYDWDVFFISIFFLLDFIFGYLFSFKKDIFLKRYFNQSLDKKYFFITGFLTFFIVVLSIVIFYNVIPNFNLKTEIWNFVSFREMLIPQGIILIPLMYIATNLQYKMEFLNNGKFNTMTREGIWKSVLKDQIVTLIFLFLALTLSFIVVLPSLFWIISLTIVLSIYRFCFSSN